MSTDDLILLFWLVGMAIGAGTLGFALAIIIGASA